MMPALSRPALILILQVAFLTGSILALKWSSFGDKEYAVVYENMNWLAAQKYCAQLGGGLAHADTQERNNFLISLTDKSAFLWIGASNAYDRKTWDWHNPLKPMTFTDWQSTQPSDPAGENCMVYWKSSEGYKWGDASCANNIGFLCQRGLHVDSSDQHDKTVQGGDEGCRSSNRSRQKCLTICL